MISQLRLINFQRHEDRTFKFCPTTNVIIGENNGGKSSIVRAMYWLSNNKPAGDWMRRFDPDGEEGERLDTTVILKTVCGHTIKRIKGENGNEYWLDQEKFTSVGRGGPPLPIAELLGIVSLPFGKDLIPFIGMQDESPFMIFESAPSKGSLLNYLTGVDVGDRMRKALTKEARQLTADINRNLSTIEEDKIELEKYAGLDDLSARMDKAVALEGKHERSVSLAETLTELQGDWSDTDRRGKWLKEQVKLVTQVIGYTEQYQRTQKTLEHLNALNHTGINPKQLMACEAGLKAQKGILSAHAAAGQTLKELENLQICWHEIGDDIDEAHIIRGKCMVELSKLELCSKCKGTGVVAT